MARENGATVAERVIEADGVELCVESFGERGDPAVLLIMGAGASMLWWEEGFCRMLAGRGFFVIRYDHRDTGRSVTYEPGHPEYDAMDLVADAVRVLDAHDLRSACLLGVSAGGGIAQMIALAHPERVDSLVLVSTTSALPGPRELPPPADAFTRFVAAAEVDWGDRESIADYLTGYQRVLAGDQRPFDEAAARALVRRDLDRARNPAAAQNHEILGDGEAPAGSLTSIAAPTLVIHGTADPMFPLGHGRALAEEIPGARLLSLEGAGHGIDRSDWETIVDATVEHASGSS